MEKKALRSHSFLGGGQSKDTMIIKMNSDANLEISTREVLIFFLNALCLSCRFFCTLLNF